jgi:hypothetical protein
LGICRLLVAFHGKYWLCVSWIAIGHLNNHACIREVLPQRLVPAIFVKHHAEISEIEFCLGAVVCCELVVTPSTGNQIQLDDTANTSVSCHRRFYPWAELNEDGMRSSLVRLRRATFF